MTTQIAPETADGWIMLHQLFEIDWGAIHRLDAEKRNAVAVELSTLLEPLEKPSEEEHSRCYHVLGHKADLMIIHYRKTVDGCAQTELMLNRLGIWPYLRQTTSYLSVVELGLYHATHGLYEDLEQEGLQPGSDDFQKEFGLRIVEEKKKMLPRLFAPIPGRNFVCFYPMNKLRTDQNNWYTLPLEERAMLMMEHGMIGRKYAGKVSQVISGSIGFDDWEWGVDLHVDDPLVVKDLVYELRFDEGSAKYGEFGAFFFGRRLQASSLPHYFSGTLPTVEAEPPGDTRRQ